ncbi:unnamed protein product [Rotaria sp. Silwood2]|nr:unnamed protein product [Rotaria sp. Silwood2]CAF2512269.1 unnamed protein product [Rotaria sp. Silwood2]CAF2889727.1 unnamed protein product [Rotaria sp. Silwood2]CAF3983499.1 unnamed protein product [Rotaria sp. Silwood2]CAF4095686.1 unnamed protein product [Rotaria sp. Silwood2]
MSSTSSSMSTTDIIGIVIGGVLGLATVIGLIITIAAVCCKKNNKSQVWAQPNPYESNPYQPPYGAPYGQSANTGHYPQQFPHQQPQQQSWNQQSTDTDRLPTYSAVHAGSRQLFQLNGANVQFPQLNNNKLIIIKLITLPFSSVVSLTLYDQYDHVVTIKNTTNPFEILITRKINSLRSPMIRQNVRLLSNNLKFKFKFYYINLTQA